MSGLIGYGTYVEVHDGVTAEPGGWFEVGLVTNVTPPNESTDQVESTHMKSPNRTKEFEQGMIDPGEMSLAVNHIPGSTTDDYVVAWRVSGETRSVRLVYPNDKFQRYPAFVLGWAPDGIDVSGLMKATLNLKVAGAIARGTMGA
ncbi:phage tail tube protein [Phenylobacterium sp.]|uniref:phage tail tube protein n=1 Tax=Phenylobacterium sp. TaxID=1871053 RepID=UPI0027347383|nr:phage tail tube protein [Phenylobacterium sp.]MDP3853618.1 phage tail tube protein [Phenylobacterium sp.]